MGEEDDMELVGGNVKWFDPNKGFGFILSDHGGPDILLHTNVLRNYGQSSVADGARISVKAQKTDRGKQAVEVLSIEPPETAAGIALADLEGLDEATIAAAALEPARVKWFDKAKGYGFVNVFFKNDDIFVHVEVLRRSGLADLQAGEAVAVRVINGKRGLMAAQLLSWDSATIYH